ncbi:helix-turn-helix domain-containing protein [Flavobacterium qiangtangense]|uniref:Helix-turn-helix domain-containing protein n=1 Tax=Flavobacterium qiangtangense TaxID=1442595 RepID=A0ABW1PLA9_9FLAO
MSIPTKLLTRKDEITADFLKLFDNHVSDLLNLKTEKRFSTSDYASMLFIHPRHLTNTIKLTTGKSPCNIMEERLVDEAKKMILETDLSMAEIGQKIGYDEPTNFVKFFKGMEGITPLQFRKLQLQLK